VLSPETFFWLKCIPTRSAAGASPHDPSGDRAHIAPPDSVPGKGEEGMEEEGKGREKRLPPLKFKSGYAFGYV